MGGREFKGLEQGLGWVGSGGGLGWGVGGGGGGGVGRLGVWWEVGGGGQWGTEILGICLILWLIHMVKISSKSDVIQFSGAEPSIRGP